jgi:hypothetical protein
MDANQTILATYEASRKAGEDLAYVLGRLDAARALGLSVDGDSLIASLQAIGDTIRDARTAATALMVRSGQAG